MPKRDYKLSRAAHSQRRAASAASASARGGTGKDWSTVRIERRVRDAAARRLREGESLADLVGSAVATETERRSEK